MAKMSKEEQARREGIAYAYRVAKEKGVEGLALDIKNRGITDCPVGISNKDMEKFVENVKFNTMDTVLIVVACTLQDEFGFGKKRIDRFIKRFNLKAAVLDEGYATWDDFKEQLVSELNLHLTIRNNDKDVIVEKE